MEAKQCEYCGQTYLPKYKVSRAYWARRRFCDDGCKAKAHRPPRRTGAITPLEERLWRKVDQRGEDECWLWQGIKDGCGYGMMYKTQTPKVTWYKVHRLAYELSVGPIPPGLHVLHRCDMPACCNPAHLWVGTHADNMRDKEAKGRGHQIGSPGADRRGMKNGNARLSDDQIAEVRQLYASGEYSQQRLANRFGVGQTQISRIVRREQRIA